MKSKRVLKEAKIKDLCNLLFPEDVDKKDWEYLYNVLWRLNHRILDRIFTNPFIVNSLAFQKTAESVTFNITKDRESDGH